MTTNALQHTPDDADLQELYNQVWASFADDDDISPPAAVGSASRYGPVENTSTKSTSPVSTTPSAGSYAGHPYMSTRDAGRPLPNFKDTKSPVSAKNYPRPLPVPPGASHASTPTMTMPEPRTTPEAVLPPPPPPPPPPPLPPQHMPRSASDPLYSRQLPLAPDGVYRATSANSTRKLGLPSTIRPQPRSPHPYRDANPDARAESPTSSTSPRPPGALAPGIPGYDPRFDALEDTVANDSGVAGVLYTNFQSPKHVNGHNETLPPIPTSAATNRTVTTSPRNSVEDPRPVKTASPVTHAMPPQPSIYEQYQKSALLDRSVSLSSGASSTMNGTLDRGPSVSVSPDLDSGLPSSSSFATTIDDGSSAAASGTAKGQQDYLKMKDVYYSGAGGSFNELVESSTRPYRPNAFEQAVAAVAAAKGKAPLELQLHVEEDEEEEDWDEEEDETRFINFALLSNIAVRLRDKIPRGTHVKGSIPYPRAFTGKDIVSTIQSQIQRELLINHGLSTNDRRAALQVARSLQSQLFFYEVEWGGRVLQDGVDDVYMFLDDQEGGHDARQEKEELPTGVITMLTKCYSPSCVESSPCYSYCCPRRQQGNAFLGPPNGPTAEPETRSRPGWSEVVESEIIRSLPESEINRQTIIHKVISKEEQYVQDLDTIETAFIRPLRTANPPVIPRHELDQFIEDVFGNILDLRECNRRLLECLYVRQREQAPVIQRIGDVFLGAATEFRLAYPIYIGHLPLAEKRMKDEIDSNPEFRIFLEECSRHTERQQDSPRLDLKHFLNRPSEHLQKYPVLLEAIYRETAEGNPDAEYLMEAIQAIKNLQSVALLRTFQSAMCRGPTSKWEWADLVDPDIRKTLSKNENKRQAIMFELIKGEMSYVKDLETVQLVYVQPLRAMDPPIISRERLDTFMNDVFHNIQELYSQHCRLVERFHEIQREEHPTIRSLTAAMFDAALNFRDAYLEYVPNYPIAAYRIDSELATNPAFKTFHEECRRHPDSHRFDLKHFVNRPIPRLLRYQLLLQSIFSETPQEHEDQESIPQVLDVLKALGKETEPGVQSSEQKVELWRYNANLVYKPGESTDLDLLNENRSLLHTGKVLRQPETGFEWSGWSELTVLVFDNYLVLTKPREKDGIIKYQVNRRPIPFDLLTLTNFNDPPTQRGTGLLRGLRGGEKQHGDQANPTAVSPDTAGDSRYVYPFTFHHSGRMGGLYTLYSESALTRLEWKQKLEEAIGLRKIVQESNRVFEIETLSADTFLIPSMVTGPTSPSWSLENSYTGKVTCSVPFTTSDGRGLVAIGCAEGVWIGFRHDSRSMRRVLHLKMVTQCAMLEDFGIFLVLADKSLFAYHIEALVPTSPQSAHASQTPQKLNGTKDVHFFSVGTLMGRTLVIYMKKKGLDSVFRVLEPVVGKINEKAKAPTSFGSRLGLRTQKSEWFRVYRDFFLPSEAFDLIFLKAKIAILCTKGFEIMDLTDFKSVTIPQREDPRLEKIAKRCESCRPMGMFRCNEDEFLLCYDEFGLYVDKHGETSRSNGAIEWEGTAERVALHYPYVLLFDSKFIEIRDIETGRLTQIIQGQDVRCIWDGRQPTTRLPQPGQDGWQENSTQEARVHGVMNSTEPVIQPGSGRPLRAVAQHVFELIPTIPLFLPERIAPPANNAYFAHSPSPPRSPRHTPSLTPTSSWRS